MIIISFLTIQFDLLWSIPLKGILIQYDKTLTQNQKFLICQDVYCTRSTLHKQLFQTKKCILNDLKTTMSAKKYF